MKLRLCIVIVSFLSAMVGTILAQTATSTPTSASTQVPRLIRSARYPVGILPPSSFLDSRRSFRIK